MPTAPPLTIVTTTYNWPGALKLAMQSALAQTFTDFEYLVVGDCCTDETEDVVRSFDDPRIIWCNLPENTGNQSGANKVALELARGDAIAYLNHDDLWFPDHLETLHGPLTGDGLDIVSSLSIEIGPPGSVFRHVLGMPWHASAGEVYYNPMTTTVMHTAKAAREAGGWRDWREVKEIPTHAFFNRVRRLREKCAVIAHATALKFHSGSRPNCYRTKTAEEQHRFAQVMRTDPDFRYKAAMWSLACVTTGERHPTIPHPRVTENDPPGAQIEQWRRIRGLHPMIDLGANAPDPPPETLATPSLTDPEREHPVVDVAYPLSLRKAPG